MSEVPVEIQCPRNPEQACPLLEAEQKLEALYATPPEERGTLDEFNARIKEISLPLSRWDRERYYAMQGTSEGRSVLRAESCVGGPEKSAIFFGKMSCAAQTEYRPWQTTTEQAA